MAIPEKYAHIDFVPPKAAQEAARRGLEWRKQYGRGGTSVGVARARDISNGKQLSPETVMRMYQFFSRHSNHKGTHYKLRDGVPTTWRIAWDLWGDWLARHGLTRLCAPVVDFPVPLKIPAKTDIEIRGQALQAGGNAACVILG